MALRAEGFQFSLLRSFVASCESFFLTSFFVIFVFFVVPSSFFAKRE